jgi:hypothetical protein
MCRSVEGGLGCGGVAATSLFLLNLFGFGPFGGLLAICFAGCCLASFLLLFFLMEDSMFC